MKDKNATKTPFTPKEILVKIAAYCAYQERCESEVRKKLLELGARAYDMEEYLEELRAENYLNEARFASAFATGKFRHKKWGKMKIAQGLMQKKVADDLIHQALDEIDPDEYYDTIANLLQKKHKSLKESDSYKAKAKLFNFAASKGYEPDIVWEVIRELIG